MIDIGADLQRAFDEGYEKGKAEMYEHMKNRLDDEYDAGYCTGKADRPQGEWIDAGTDLDGTHYYRCSNCGWEVETDYPNCPYCIAKMKGADDEDN